MKLTLKHAIAAIILMLRAGPLEDADAAIKRRDYATAVAATFIGLAVVAPERVDRTMMDILNKIVTAVAGNYLVALPPMWSQRVSKGAQRFTPLRA